MSSNSAAFLAIIALAPPLWLLALRPMDNPFSGSFDAPPAVTNNVLRDDTPDDAHHTFLNKRRATTGTLLFNSDRYEFAMVTDLDKASREGDTNTWKAYLKRGFIEKLPNGNFTVSWGNTTAMKTHTATKGRSMELSELVRFNRNFFAMCDMTGIIWKVEPDTGRVFQRYAIADGDGDEPKPFKIEWSTVKDSVLWVGSVGKELSGSVRPAEWVKTVHPTGDIHNIDWGAVYQALRTATNTSYPGYLWHEAVHFDQRNRRWMILPRKESQTLYDEDENMYKGSNLLIIASEDFSKITVRRVGPNQGEGKHAGKGTYGFTTLRKLPGTNANYIALKVAEFENATHNVQHTVFTVFDASTGRLLLDSPTGFAHVDDMKYEGIEFLNFGSQVQSLTNKFDNEL